MKKIVFSLVLFILLIGVSGCGGADESSGASESDSGGDNSEETFEWSLLSFVGMQHPMTEFLIEFSEEITERTNGQLTVTTLPPGELPYEPSEYLRVTGEGGVEMTDTFLPFHSGELNVASISDLPFLMTSFDELEQAMDEVMLPHIEDEFASHGTKLLFWYPWPEQNLWGQKEAVTEVDQLKNLSIRSQSPEQGAFLEKVDAIPVSLDTPEVPAAMERGVIDGVITASLNILGSQWHEFTDWGYFINFLIPPSYIVVNEEAYNELPENIREIVDEVAAEYQEKLPDHIAQIESDYKSTLIEEHGIEINDATEQQMEEFINTFSPYWEQWASEQDPQVGEILQKVRDVLGK
ncbi:TRAP transporter substrate-binding protein DctP [Alkalihalobacillus oceani]|uniref:TRAP transporter substrate-binding protein DctP n=1 Tax=Halalkalibacter oceani TaxID=1653776 RepID=A0A9X2IRK2_9BACI|nr:TRAP transporter substrate-binding protein DctP [Halalkalibacter oceani]MCM3716512.1 TRAP transporter substrate-binding protein DctP [Halalkalibacter oceani]